MCHLVEQVVEYNDHIQWKVLTVTEQCEQSEVSTPSRTPIEDPTRIGFPPSKFEHIADLRMKLFTLLWEGVESLNSAECSQ